MGPPVDTPMTTAATGAVLGDSSWLGLQPAVRSEAGSAVAGAGNWLGLQPTLRSAAGAAVGTGKETAGAALGTAGT